MKPWLDDGDVRLYHGHVLDVLRSMPSASVDCIVTSPPYFGLRDYGVTGQIGLEKTPAAYLATLVDVFREARRVLADHGCAFVNLGDSYAGSWDAQSRDDTLVDGLSNGQIAAHPKRTNTGSIKPGMPPPKNLLMMPARLAIALQDDGWILRRDIIWSKPNPMPESATDRCTSAHEYVFHLVKRPRYWYDQEAIREKVENVQPPRRLGRKEYEAAQVENGHHGARGVALATGQGTDHSAGNHFGRVFGGNTSRNARSVWEIATQPTPEAHFATYPEELVRRCLLAGCPLEVCRTCGKPRERIVERETLERCDLPAGDPRRRPTRYDAGKNGEGVYAGTGQRYSSSTTLGWSDCGHADYRRGVVLDPFIGSGTTARVARNHGRHAIGIDLSAEYLAIAAKRLQQLSLLGGIA